MQTVTTIGLDIARSDAEGKVILRRQLKRRYVMAFCQKLPSCLVGIEACASSHHWSPRTPGVRPHRSADAAGLREALRQAP